MSPIRNLLLALLILAAVLVLLRLTLLGVRSRRAGGPAERFTACPATPNCVSSRASDPGRRVEPLAVPGDPAEAMRRLRRVLEQMPRTRVAESEAGYLRAESRSAIFGFVDDLELLWDAEAGAIQVRSASRQGHSDLGANRRRVEALRARFESG